MTRSLARIRSAIVPLSLLAVAALTRRRQQHPAPVMPAPLLPLWPSPPPSPPAGVPCVPDRLPAPAPAPDTAIVQEPISGGSQVGPTCLGDLSGPLLGHEVTVSLRERSDPLVGTVAATLPQLTILCTDAGLVYIDTADITAVRTGARGRRRRAARERKEATTATTGLTGCSHRCRRCRHRSDQDWTYGTVDAELEWDGSTGSEFREAGTEPAYGDAETEFATCTCTGRFFGSGTAAHEDEADGVPVAILAAGGEDTHSQVVPVSTPDPAPVCLPEPPPVCLPEPPPAAPAARPDRLPAPRILTPCGTLRQPCTAWQLLTVYRPRS